MMTIRRTAVLAGFIALAAASTIGLPAHADAPAKPQPFDGPGTSLTFLQRNSDHQNLENALRAHGYIQFAPGRWSNEGHEIDVPPPEQMTRATYQQVNARMMEISREVDRQTFQHVGRGGSGGGGGCREGGDNAEEAGDCK